MYVTLVFQEVDTDIELGRDCLGKIPMKDKYSR